MEYPYLRDAIETYLSPECWSTLRRIADRSTRLTAAGESHMDWEFAGSCVSPSPFPFSPQLLSLSLSLSLALSAGYRPPLHRHHRSVLVRADVNACWVAVPDAGFI